MSSPLAHKSTNGTTQALSLRNSTFAPANLGDIPRMNTSAELSSLADATSSSTETEKKPIQDYGYFRTGTVQYGHAHWKNKDQVTSNAAPTGTQSDMQLTVDPSTLQSDADSIRIKICNNASSNSVNTKLSSSPKSDITGRRLPQAQQSALNKTSITQDNSTPQTVASENVGRPEITEQSEDTESSKKQEKQENIPPVPVDIRDHPSNFQTPTQQVDPFRTVTESRVLSAQWRAAEVQQGTNGQDSMFDYRHRPQNDHIMRVVSNSDAEDQIISIHEAAFEGPADATESTNPKTPTSRKSFTGSWGKARATTRSSTPATDTSKRSTPAGVRSISNLFRTRTSQESERFSGDKFQKDRVSLNALSFTICPNTVQELYLRTMTCTLPNANISMYPKHPNTNRPWMHKNLRCTNCTDKWCSRCKRACCAYKAAVEGAKNHPSGPNHHRALGHAEEIGKFRKYGTELPTFMKCTDCEEMFCPDCCGECADPQCRLVCCRGCKSDPWVNCDFHENH